MRILFLTHRIPYPPDKGDKIRSFRMLEALAREHDVALITHADDPRDVVHRAELERRCRSVAIHARGAVARALGSAVAFLRGRPLSFGRFTSAAAARDVRHALAHDAFDVVVVFSAQPAEYLPPGLRVPVIVDLVDVDSEKWRAYAERARGPMRWIYRREQQLVAGFERDLAASGVTLSLVTEGEAAQFRERIADVPLRVIPNGVAPVTRRRAPVPGLLLFTGAMDYAPNAEAAAVAARDILPRVRAIAPAARLRIAGRNPTRAVRALAELPGVEIGGAVASIASELESAELCLLPLRVVRGVPNKLLEAFANGIPVVTTNAALASVGARHGVHAFACDGPVEAAGAVTRLLADAALRAKIGDAGRDFVLERFRWERFDDAVLALVEEVAGQEVRA